VVCGDVGQDFGIDMYLRGVERRDQEYRDTGPQIDLQLKSTTRAEIRGDDVVYDLEVRAYDLLREELPQGPPRILVLLVLPDDETLWLSQSTEELILRRCAYWRWLRGAEPTTAHTTVRVTIPCANVFSVAALQAMMNRVKQGETP
jgi:hypothetical protein